MKLQLQSLPCMVYECEVVVSKALRYEDRIDFRVGNAPSVSETHISDMDSDEKDDVPLARLLKKGFAFNVASAKSTDLVISARS
ncbi:uncharacterized protein E6C27_scaffold213G00070 [Cucumis melo var. makuwa]|uniref:Uncharacterized protein n=1 Tax=Cucumis melo var. makuwa TaxID=1194695 RepID=A0A5A7SU78_CUCMM|nr:uncharacterized protein E6C27_scaffold213G00070 [Cucumis melo var. makuwa]